MKLAIVLLLEGRERQLIEQQCQGFSAHSPMRLGESASPRCELTFGVAALRH